jgi:hypothetical protein
MEPAVRIFEEPDAVDRRLAELGLTRAPLLRAIEVGEAQRRNATAHDPMSAPGFDKWRYATRTLRDDLVPKGWRASHLDGLERVVHPRGHVHIVVMLGSAATGDRWRTPSSKYPRGPSSFAYVEMNTAQRYLFGAQEHERAKRRVAAPEPSGVQTWTLLHFSSMEEVRCELSLPAAIGEDLRVHDWFERILLPPILIDPNVPEAPDADEPPDVDFDVRRKSAGR